MSYHFIEWWYHSPIFWEIFLIDWLSKIAAYSLLAKRTIVITNFLSLELSYNSGIAWSLFASHKAVGYYTIIAVTFCVLAVLAKYTTDRQKQGYSVTGETLLLAGGFSNFIDRLLHRGVIDFIKISFGKWSFPIFNIADIAISVGAILILYQFFFDDES